MPQEVQDSKTLTCLRSVSCWTYILRLHTTELIFAKSVLFYPEKSRYWSLLSSLQDLKISFVDSGGRFWYKQTICQFFNPNGWCFQESLWGGLFERVKVNLGLKVNLCFYFSCRWACEVGFCWVLSQYDLKLRGKLEYDLKLKKKEKKNPLQSH